MGVIREPAEIAALCGHRPRRGGCHLCKLAGGPRPQSVATCPFFGKRVNRPGQVREWHECTHPEQPLGPLVCRCKGCGPTCPGYPPAGV